MRILTHTIPAQYHEKTVQEFLRRELHCSGTLIKLLKQQTPGILLNTIPVRTVDRVCVGDCLTLHLPEGGYRHTPAALPLEVVYEDADVLVVNKPPFMAVHHSANHTNDTLANSVAGYLEQKGLSLAFHAVNRLDRDTSGLVLLGLHSYAAARLSGTVQKTYFAVVDGIYEGTGTVDLPIQRKPGSVILREVGAGGQRAVTHWESMQIVAGLSLLKIHLETGRTHQIRVHFSHLGTPVLGDTLYSAGDGRIGRQALHCGVMEFTQPVTGEVLLLESPLPVDMKKLLE